ncbi:MAG: DUF1573 domain-containing protein [Xylanivirga thermophila]|uniref:DUF1573 domain-containing protein n=1 Tax=Xylanivirga thermophila TaxID=2496273 RepID=UPI00101E1DAE|nr:DUF1573 domain-containing protein [Xylanivirga thermophila]
MDGILYDDFQTTVSQLLTRHRSIVDLLSKYQESNARVNRAIAKSVTSCGCISINAQRQQIPDDATLEQLQQFMDSHIEGELCDNCRSIIEKELGNNLFYLVSLAETLDINIYDVILNEQKDLSTLGKFHLK